MDTRDELQDKLNVDARKEYKRENGIGKLKRRMYSRSRKGFLPWRSRRDAGSEVPLIKSDWEEKEIEPERLPKPPKKKSPIGVNALLIFSIVFFVVAGIGALVYLRLAIGTAAAGGIDIVIEGSTAISSGDVLELQVLVTNRNESPLELADLIVSYPDGTVSPTDFRTPLVAERIPLGRVDARSARRGAVRAVILGDTGSLREVEVELQYRLKGSNSIHSRTTAHSVLLSTDAMSVSVEANKELTPGQNLPMAITIKSHSSTILHGVYLDLSFPFGFNLVDSSLAAEQREDSTESLEQRKARWLLGSLRPGEERVVQLSGTLDGQTGDMRTVNVGVGSGLFEAYPDDEDELHNIILAKAEHSIEVRRSFLEVYLDVNGTNLDSYVAYAGQAFDVTVNWFNNLNEPINDATIAITLGGSALNKAGVNPGRGGFYRSVDSLLLWDAKTSGDDLKVVPPGASGEFKFKLTPLPQSYLQKIRTPSLSFAVHAAGKRLGEQGVPEVLKDDILYEVKVGTDSMFSAYSLYNSSPFGTLGPLPPKVEYETTYGVVWEVANTTSDIEGAVVRAELPHYVRWVGLTLPASEQLLYNKSDNTLEWHLGIVKAGTGTMSAEPRRVSFALGLVPSATQIGNAPSLVRNQSFDAIDSYTGEPVGSNIDDVDIRTVNDIGYDDGTSRVVK